MITGVSVSDSDNTTGISVSDSDNTFMFSTLN